MCTAFVFDSMRDFLLLMLIRSHLGHTVYTIFCVEFHRGRYNNSNPILRRNEKTAPLGTSSSKKKKTVTKPCSSTVDAAAATSATVDDTMENVKSNVTEEDVHTCGSGSDGKSSIAGTHE